MLEARRQRREVRVEPFLAHNFGRIWLEAL